MMTTTAAKYAITTVGVPGPSSGKAKYMRWGQVRVYDATQPGYAGLGKGTNRVTIYESSPVDTRYSGPKSAYGQALAEARQICDEANAKAMSDGAIAIDSDRTLA